MRESLRFVLVANDICSSISERDDDDEMMREREYKESKKKNVVFPSFC